MHVDAEHVHDERGVRFLCASRRLCVFNFMSCVNYAGASLRGTARLFGISTSTASRILWRIVDLIVNSLAKEHITWPTLQQLAISEAVIHEKYTLHSVTGFIDGTHIRMMPQSVEDHTYAINRKGWHSIVLQGTCDASGRFLNVFTGCYGRVHDARVLACSQLAADNKTRDSNHGPLTLPDPFVLLGDAAYPLSHWIVTPYATESTPQQILFNKRHSSARMCIERAFGKLKSQWQLLKKNESYGAAATAKIATACCVLHNITFDIDPTHGWQPSDEAREAATRLEAELRESDEDNSESDSDSDTNRDGDGENLPVLSPGERARDLIAQTLWADTYGPNQ